MKGKYNPLERVVQPQSDLQQVETSSEWIRGMLAQVTQYVDDVLVSAEPHRPLCLVLRENFDAILICRGFLKFSANSLKLRGLSHPLLADVQSFTISC